MKRSEKVTLVEELTATLASAKSIILADITGIRVNDQNRLRRMLTEVDAKLIVTKNTLLSRALANSKVKAQSVKFDEFLTGQTAVIVSPTNEVESVQVLGKFIKELEMPKLKVGIISGSIYDESALIKISKLPGREVLARQVVGAISSPLYGLVGTLQGNLQKLLYILSNRPVGTGSIETSAQSPSA
ncbi:50S ribosomal protein L10 [Candidatus Microgenomates bacterium]|nr:50S ribosomal protein L10 [Candidatus Microgenomates bacterium]